MYDAGLQREGVAQQQQRECRQQRLHLFPRRLSRSIRLFGPFCNMLYWIYDIPTWLFGVLTVGSVTLLACIGLIVMRPWIRRHLRVTDDTNEAVNAYFAGVGVFYGLLSGLVAVATWQNFDAASALISSEASAFAALYRDVSSYPSPIRETLQDDLRSYLVHVIEQDWPAQQRGKLLQGGTRLLSHFQGSMTAFEPATNGQEIVHEEAFRAFNHLVEARRLRLDAVGGGLPPVLWSVVLIGAVLSVVVTYFFHIGDRKLHLILTAILAVFIGLMIFLTAAVDNPFRGEVSVTADPYRLILDSLLTQPKP